jgi:AcrR family transcriptional regulator
MPLLKRGCGMIQERRLSRSRRPAKEIMFERRSHKLVAESVMFGSIPKVQHLVDKGARMPNTFHSRKQDMVRDAIFDAAIDLFARDGFDETTLEDVSKAAGVSARTLYRYFATRDELLAHGIVGYGKQLVLAVNECSAKMSPLETVRYAALSATEYTIAQPRIREIIKISSTHPSVRQAQQAGIVGIQTRLSEAFAARLRNASIDDLKPRMLASVTLMVVERALPLWFQGPCKDAPSAVKQVFMQLSHLFSESIY